jgi:PLP dependent protein
MENKEIILENLQHIYARIADACKKASRNKEDVRLLLATKTQDANTIKIALDAGEKLIGENKVQEYTEKWDELKDYKIERHFIGHLQTNKIKEVIKYVTCIESVDRLDLAQKLSAKLVSENKNMEVYIEVNTSEEESKSGVTPENTLALIQQINTLPNIQITGLMTIGKPTKNPEDTRYCFQILRKLKEEGQAQNILPQSCALSMGMSHDLEVAIEEGSTIVRVGSAIFGNRNYAK